MLFVTRNPIITLSFCHVAGASHTEPYPSHKHSAKQALALVEQGGVAWQRP